MRSDHVLRILISVTALGAAAIKLKYPHLVDVITLGLLVLAFLPWLAPIIKTFELTGFGKIELREIQEQVQEAKGVASSAERQAQLALASIETGSSDGTAATSAEEELAKLEEEYNNIRNTQKASAQRTSAMTDVVSRIRALAPKLRQFNVAEALEEKENAGRRLAGYVYLYAQPDSKQLERLVKSVTEIDSTPFGQYWGLQAVGKIIEKDAGQSIPSAVIDQLRTFLSRLKHGTDRYYVLNNILKGLED